MIQSCFSIWLAKEYFRGAKPLIVLPEIGQTFRRWISILGFSEADMLVIPNGVNALVPKFSLLKPLYGEAYTGASLDGKPLPYDMPSSLMRNFGQDFFRRSEGKEERARKIYVSRRDSSMRPLQNEADLEKLLSERGFEIVVQSKLDPVAQMETFRSADVIVTPHGAGLSNILFCRPETKVVELVSDFYQNACFCYLSQIMGVKHTVYLSKLREELHSSRHLQSWSVDLDEAMSTIEAAMQK
jgi:hypothetical protein